MSNGYAGKILRLNLTNKTSSTLDTAQYETWGGGNGMGTAVFWDVCQNKTADPLSPDNVTVIMTNPLTGTLAPSTGRSELVGISAYTYPGEWFQRSSMGGYFGEMLKCAGYDGVTVEGAADKPVWVNIIDDKVIFEDATSLWGKDTWATQKDIWWRVTGRSTFEDWMDVGNGSTTQGPIVLCIGPMGETLSRISTLQSGACYSFSRGGWGAVWGSKNLKAISVLGTGSIGIADIKGLMAARKALQLTGCRPASPTPDLDPTTPGRVTACVGCAWPCHPRKITGFRQDTKCANAYFFWPGVKIYPGNSAPGDIASMYGIDAYEQYCSYAYSLYMMGIIGPGKEIDSSPVPFDKFGTVEYVDALYRSLVSREGIGKYMADGRVRMALELGRYDEDIANGIINVSQWGYDWHWSTPEVSFAFGSLLGSRDTNEHCWQETFNAVNFYIKQENLPADKLVELLSEKTIPYTDDPLMFDYSLGPTGIYSEHKAKQVAWHRYYCRYYKQSMGFCDWVWPMFVNPNNKDGGYDGFTPEYEPKLINAVTGKNMTFADGIQTGRKIWNLKRAILCLQGRNRDNEKFTEYMYNPKATAPAYVAQIMGGVPIQKDGKWVYDPMSDMILDRDGVEQFKTNYYKLEGWDVNSGQPTRKSLEELGMKNVADTLEAAGKLGSHS